MIDAQAPGLAATSPRPRLGPAFRRWLGRPTPRRSTRCSACWRWPTSGGPNCRCRSGRRSGRGSGSASARPTCSPAVSRSGTTGRCWAAGTLSRTGSGPAALGCGAVDRQARARAQLRPRRPGARRAGGSQMIRSAGAIDPPELEPTTAPNEGGSSAASQAGSSAGCGELRRGRKRAWLGPGGEEGTEFCGGAAEFREGGRAVSDDEGVEGGRAGVVAVNRVEGEAARGGSGNDPFGGIAGG